jgi:hypothetical protein
MTLACDIVNTVRHCLTPARQAAHTYPSDERCLLFICGTLCGVIFSAWVWR